MPKPKPGLGGKRVRPYLAGGSTEKTDNRSVSDRNEKRLAKRLGATRTPNSGATAFWKGDYVTDNLMFQEKTCQGSRLVVSETDIVQAYREATMQGRLMAFTFTIRGLPSHVPKDYVMVPLDTWEYLIKDSEES